MAAKFKKETVKNTEFAKGGDTPMFGQGDRTTTAGSDAAGSQKPGETSHDTSGAGGKFAAGGGGKMFGYTGSQPARAGITSAR